MIDVRQLGYRVENERERQSRAAYSHLIARWVYVFAVRVAPRVRWPAVLEKRMWR
jgi:hypothetical protein